jgi:hypothetical protein
MPDNLLAVIDQRADQRSAALRRIVERYGWLMDRGREAIRPRFDAGQLGLLCDILNGSLLELLVVGASWMEAANAGDEYYSKWHVERADLVDLLESLSPWEELALLDAVERFWLAVGHGVQVDPATILAESERPERKRP